MQKLSDIYGYGTPSNRFVRPQSQRSDEYEAGVSIEEATLAIAPECLPENNLCDQDLEEALEWQALSNANMEDFPFGDENFEEETSQVDAVPSVRVSFPEEDSHIVLHEVGAGYYGDF